jgi:hypothetical protein
MLVLAALATACAPNVDLDAVQKYAQATADAGASFAAVADDFGESCLRRRELTLQAADLPRTIVELAPAVSIEPSPAAAPSPAPAPSPTTGVDVVSDPTCARARAISAEWDKHNAIVLAYVQALGAIAKVDDQPTFAPLGDALTGAKLMTTKQESAFAKLGPDIASIAIAGEQRRDIASAVDAVNPSLHVAIDALKEVDAAYAEVLNAEFNETFAFYNALIRSEVGSAPDRLSPHVRDEIYLQRQRFNAALEAINTRRAATIAYASVLDGILKTHVALYDASQRGLRPADYVAIFQANVVPLYRDVESLKKVTK